MNKIAKAAKKVRSAGKANAVANAVINYMGGISYELSPIESLKMVTTSSIFAEPAYTGMANSPQKPCGMHL